MTIYDNSGGGRRGAGVSRLLILVLLVLVLAIGALFVLSRATGWFSPGTQTTTEDASGGPDPAAPVP